MYDKNGNPITIAFDVGGNDLTAAYDVNGNIIYNRNYDYTDYTITNASIGNQGQGCDVYKKTLAIWDANEYRFRLYNIDTKANFANVGTVSEVHGNDLSFSSEFVNEGDEYPLLYVNTDGYRIAKSDNVWSATLTKVYDISEETPQGSIHAYAFNGNILYSVGYKNDNYNNTNNNTVIVAKWDLTNIVYVGNNVYVPTLISYAERNWLNCIQGATYHDGYLWIVCGLGGTNAIVYALNPDTGEIVYTIDSGQTGEPEGLAWAFNSTDGWYLMWWQKNAGGMKKCTFAKG